MMISSLFSMFDPCSSVVGVSVKWVVVLCPLLFINWCVFMMPLGVNIVYSYLFKSVYTSICGESGSKSASYMTIFVVCLLLGVFWWNEVGLVPYGFTISAHLASNFSLSLSIFVVGLIVVIWTKCIEFVAHLLPYGTPALMSPVLVAVESVGLLIRPISLAVRLMGNIVAGHLLIALLGELGSIIIVWFGWFGFASVVIGALLVGFEMAVGLVQSLIFITLLYIYWIEV